VSLAVTNTILAAGVGGMTALFVNMIVLDYTTGKSFYDLGRAMNGVLAGLMAITASCAIVDCWAAVVIGIFAGLLYLLGTLLLVKCRLDDAVDAILVHMVNGVWGMLAVGLFASPDRLVQAYGSGDHPGFFYSLFGRHQAVDGALLGAQVVGILFIVAWTLSMMLPFFVFMQRKGIFRSDLSSEIAGFDKSFFGGVQAGGGEEDQEVTSDILAAFEKRLAKKIKNYGERTPSTTKSDSSSPPSPPRYVDFTGKVSTVEAA
jgi:Amt family ammonium transporter